MKVRLRRERFLRRNPQAEGDPTRPGGGRKRRSLKINSTPKEPTPATKKATKKGIDPEQWARHANPHHPVWEPCKNRLATCGHQSTMLEQPLHSPLFSIGELAMRRADDLLFMRHLALQAVTIDCNESLDLPVPGCVTEQPEDS